MREDFNPHRLSKLASANSYPPNWPYPGRAYKASFPPMFAVDFSQEFPYGAEPSHQQQQPGLGMPGGGGPGMQPHMVSPSMVHAQPQMYGQAYGGYYQQYRFAGPVSPPPISSSSLLIVLRLTLPLPPCLPFSSLVCRKACPRTATTLDRPTVHPTTPTH